MLTNLRSNIKSGSGEAPDIRKFWLIVQKDIMVEWRTKDMWVTMMAFVLMVIFVFAFAVDTGRVQFSLVFPGILWMAFLFAGMIGISRTYAHEVPEDTLTGLILAPGDRMTIFLAKLTTAFLFMMGMEAIATPIFFSLFNEPWNGSWGPMILILILGALGFVELGTLLSAISANLKSGEMIFTVLLFPFEIPVLICTVEATQAVLSVPSGDPWLWLHGLMAYDAIFLALPLLLYDYLWEV
ncbi:MAG: cytochrome C biogenesis protein CcmB [Sulfobacillus benefaciens]|uniref:Heme exporter protein B n=1 Tax=Sulfobacillus benefaciens TaxID=453960 RepID=A0A2T2XHU8_9FIRM|nr:MAG: cytochrome C biogenesis protein CcmB [Sulfobacillus benefaciens]